MTAKAKLHALVVTICFSMPAIALAESAATGKPVLAAAPHLQKLLREEMQALQEAMRTLASALPQGDFATIARTAKAMHDSFIFQQKLTEKDKHLLLEQLPADFVQLDQAFHQRAAKLHAAATSHDIELSVYHGSRLLESCVQCHQQFATQRFPALQADTPAHHH